MTTAVLPALAAADLLDGLLVARPRSRVVHVATPGRAGLTATGRLRQGTSPLCGQRARAWRSWPIDGRPLCARCSRLCRPVIPTGIDRGRLARLLADTLATARDLPTLNAARLAVCATSSAALVDGHPLHRHVALAQRRITPASTWPGPPPAYRPPPRRAAAQARFAALVDLPGATS